ncbi:MetQ/NlpA family ABC transporter substrate-binding protein [Sporosarcina limicola]|uniref:Lipoprotein n=1 Tax=Sporosarcina limicola TaxID=34101 RepID=A0A927MMM9_9BACL|nr:MetQ/NlpA family ABC transporter substrate-binding protein [Sporosarcina limicola]MBE1554289.1 D-methionine transport system substrate-binding protein [Sporosarcina limicola]
MRKLLVTIIILVLATALAACGGKDKASDDKSLKFGATPGPYSDMLKKAIVPGLEEKGYKIEIVEFSDYIQPNNALDSRAIDANLFQHIVYLENFSKENNMELSDLIVVPTAPLGIYSSKFKSLDEITDGATITIPNDPVNAARTLLVLESVDLIEIDPNIDPLKASEKDIVTNPKNLVVQPIEAGQLPRSVDSSDLAAVPGNFAIAADMNLLDALVLEDMPDQFRNLVAVRTEDKEKPFAKDIIEIIESEQFEKVIDSNFKGFGKPKWMK